MDGAMKSASVDDHTTTGHVAGIIGRDKNDQVGNVVGLANQVDGRRVAKDFLLCGHLFVGHADRTEEVCLYSARTVENEMVQLNQVMCLYYNLLDGIDTNALCTKFKSSALGEHINGRLGHTVAIESFQLQVVVST